MLDLKLLFEDLQTAGLESWAGTIEPLLNERMSEKSHGNFAAWRDSIANLPDVIGKPAILNSDIVGTGEVQWSRRGNNPRVGGLTRRLRTPI